MHTRRQFLPRFPSNATNGRVSIGSPELEQRFEVDDQEGYAFLERIARDNPVDMYDATNPHTFIRTTYFDTPCKRLFHSTELAQRARVRVRQYATAPLSGGPAILTDLCALEVKVSHRGSRRKARLVDDSDAIAQVIHRGGWQFDPHLGEIRALQRAARAIGIGQLRPVLTTYFRRISHTAPGVRITLDEGVVFAQANPHGRAGELAAPEAVFSRSPHLVLELKLTEPPPTWLTEAMRPLRRVEGASKFEGGMLISQRLDALAAAAAAARFQPQWRRSTVIAFDLEQTAA